MSKVITKDDLLLIASGWKRLSRYGGETKFIYFEDRYSHVSVFICETKALDMTKDALEFLGNLKTAPTEPEVKAQEWAEKKASDIVDKFLYRPITDAYLCILKDEIIAVLLDAVDMSKKCEKHDQSKTLNEKSDISRSEVKAQGFE